eukprot:11951_1
MSTLRNSPQNPVSQKQGKCLRCNICRQTKPTNAFSNSQMKKSKSQRRCKMCIKNKNCIKPKEYGSNSGNSGMNSDANEHKWNFEVQYLNADGRQCVYNVLGPVTADVAARRCEQLEETIMGWLRSDDESLVISRDNIWKKINIAYELPPTTWKADPFYDYFGTDLWSILDQMLEKKKIRKRKQPWFSAIVFPIRDKKRGRFALYGLYKEVIIEEKKDLILMIGLAILSLLIGCLFGYLFWGVSMWLYIFIVTIVVLLVRCCVQMQILYQMI